MHFTRTARVHVQMRTGKVGGKWKAASGHLARPTSGGRLQRVAVETERECGSFA